MKLAVVIISEENKEAAELIKAVLGNTEIFHPAEKGELKTLIGKIFYNFEGIIFFMAAGIVVRLISPYIKSKYTDPAVIAVDSEKRFAISLLSGHEGGANRLTYRISGILDSLPVVTTRTETSRKIIVGVGCRRNTPASEIEKAIRGVMGEYGISPGEIRLAATAWIKKNDEALLAACENMGFPLVFITKEEILNYKNDYSTSEVVSRNIGVKGVCEPCALIAGRRTKLRIKKTVIGNVTVAAAEEDQSQ